MWWAISVAVASLLLSGGLFWDSRRVRGKLEREGGAKDEKIRGLQRECSRLRSMLQARLESRPSLDDLARVSERAAEDFDGA